MCCYYCRALAWVYTSSNPQDVELLYTNFGEHAAHRNTLLGMLCLWKKSGMDFQYFLINRETWGKHLRIYWKYDMRISIYIYMYMCVFLFDNMSLVWTNFPLGNSHLKKFSYFWLLFQSLAIAHPWGWCLWRNGLTSALSPRFAAYQDGHHGDTCQNNFKPCWCPLPKISFGYANDFFSGIYIYIYI